MTACPPRRLRVGAASAVGSLVVAVASSLPAVAGPTTVGVVAVTLEDGELSISAPVDAGSLGTTSSEVGTVNGRLGQVRVSDTRGAPAGSGWTATAVSTAFTQTGGPSIGAASVGYAAGAIARTGTATYTANDPSSLAGVSPVVTATEVAGDNTATWNPTIHVTAGPDMPAGVYRGTITHSVS